MIKKLLFLLAIVLFVGCGGGKSTASRYSKKPVYKKPSTTAAARKPARSTTTKPAKSTARTSSPETLEATSRVRVTNDVVADYISAYKETAKSNMAQYGIPASIILAQGILESGAGTGSLSMGANNHFGIKCHTEWTGPSVRHDDDSAQECFRKYRDPDESYRDHALFLTTRSRYASLFKLDKDDYKAWARGLRSAGYATDIKYPEKLIGLIERYQLDKYDSEVLGRNYVAQGRPVFTDDGNSYQVSPGDTLYSISRKFSLTVDELKRLNGLSDNALSIGQYLKIK